MRIDGWISVLIFLITTSSIAGNEPQVTDGYGASSHNVTDLLIWEHHAPDGPTWTSFKLLGVNSDGTIKVVRTEFYREYLSELKQDPEYALELTKNVNPKKGVSFTVPSSGDYHVGDSVNFTATEYQKSLERSKYQGSGKIAQIYSNGAIWVGTDHGRLWRVSSTLTKQELEGVYPLSISGFHCVIHALKTGLNLE